MKRLLESIALTLLSLCILPSCGGRIIGKAADEKQEVTVGVSAARPAGVLNTTVYVGQARAVKSNVISPRYGGTLAGLYVKQGEKVSKGQVLAEIESSNLKSTYDLAEATLKQAEDGYGRVAKVHGSGGVSDVKMVEIETQLAKARIARETAAQALEDCRIKAPFSGTVSEIYTECGVDMMPTDRLLKITDVSGIEIVVPVPETEINEIRLGGKAFMDVPAIAAEEIPLTVLSKGVAASPISHSYDCSFTSTAAVDGLLPGMVCKVYLRDSSVNTVIIPSSAVRTDSEGRYVWTVDDSGTVAKKHVVTGGFSGDGIVVRSGLAEAEKVIVDGVSKVSSGMKVKTEER